MTLTLIYPQTTVCKTNKLQQIRIDFLILIDYLQQCVKSLLNLCFKCFHFRLNKNQLIGCMLLKDQVKVTLKPPMPKILCASAAYNGTFVVVRMDKPSQEESIVHFNKDGQILFQHTYKDIIDFFGMITEKEVIVLNVPENKIDIINLDTHKVIQVNHQYLFEDTASMAIYTFSQTRLFCVVEFGGLNDHRLRLTYYQYEGIKENSKPVVQWQSKDNEWTYEHNYQKMNNHSKIGWWTYKQEKEVTFTYFDLREDPNGKLSMVTTKSNLDQVYGVNGILLSISYLWEIKPNIYQLVAISNKFQHKEKCKDKHGVYNNNYIIDASINKDSATVRETRFVFEVEKDGFMYNDQLTDCFGIGNVSVFHTFRHKDGKVQKTPVYYINNETEEIIYQDTWESTCFTSNYFFPGWDGSCVVQAIYQNGDCQDITISTQKVLDPKEISLYLLLALNEDFDDDLLQDAVQLLSQ